MERGETHDKLCKKKKELNKMTNHLTGGPPAKLSRAFVYEFPNNSNHKCPTYLL